MEDTIYLVCNRERVDYMRRNLPPLRRGEILVKLNVEVEDGVFGVPTIEKHVFVEDWQKGIDIKDVEFDQDIITGEEAEMIRQHRLEQMKTILEEQGYQVTEPEAPDEEK